MLLNLRRGINRMLEVRVIGGGMGLGLLFGEEICKLIVCGLVKCFKGL